MKICYIFTNLHLASITGQPAIILKLAEYASRKKQQVYIISNISDQGQIQQKGKEFLLLTGSGNFLTYFLNIGKIIKYLRSIKPDLIHVHGHLLIIFVWVINKLVNSNLVCSICETLDVVSGLYRNILIFCLQHSQKVFVTSEYLKGQLVRQGLTPDNLVVIRIGLADKFLVDWDNAPPDTDILFYGDSQRARGFDIILELAKNLPKLKFKVLLRWQGQDCLRQLRQMNRLANVVIWQQPYAKPIEQIILKSRLVVLPYRWMGVRPPLSLVEAMALGRCVVTSSMAGNEELIKNEDNGIIVDVRKEDAISSKISGLIKNEQLRENLGHQAKQTIRQLYSLEEYSKILEHYRNLLKK